MAQDKKEPWYLSKISINVKKKVKAEAAKNFTSPWKIVESILKKHYGVK